MVRLSVNINKIATLRNARGGNIPDVQKAAVDCERFGAQGITVHPRPDERHIKYNDVLQLRPLVTTEFNVEGYPSERFMELVLSVVPEQVTLVPDAPDAITSKAGWNTLQHKAFLTDIVGRLKDAGIRVSIFVDTVIPNIETAAQIGADRVELYTEPYAAQFPVNRDSAIAPYITAANTASDAGLELNAGHDLNLDNLRFFIQHIPKIKEVSIGHALVSDALYFGLENTVQMYLRQLHITEQ